MTDSTAQTFAALAAIAILNAIIDEEFVFDTLRFIRRGATLGNKLSPASRLEPALADEIKLGLSSAKRKLQNIQLALLKQYRFYTNCGVDNRNDPQYR